MDRANVQTAALRPVGRGPFGRASYRRPVLAAMCDKIQYRQAATASWTNRVLPKGLPHVYIVADGISTQNMRRCFESVSSEQISKSTIPAIRKMPGSEGSHGQTSEHRQLCRSVVV